jgi:DNA-binding transcriptional regulator YiaG
MASEPQTLADLIREDLTESLDTARAYLRQSWVSSAITGLWKLRRSAGLTQTEVAERMGTTQSAVARWERDDDGGMSLRRYIDYVLACGAVPMDVEFRPLEDVRGFAIEQPEASRVVAAYDAWQADMHATSRRTAFARYVQQLLTQGSLSDRLVSLGSNRQWSQLQFDLLSLYPSQRLCDLSTGQGTRWPVGATSTGSLTPQGTPDPAPAHPIQSTVAA